MSQFYLKTIFCGGHDRIAPGSTLCIQLVRDTQDYARGTGVAVQQPRQSAYFQGYPKAGYEYEVP